MSFATKMKPMFPPDPGSFASRLLDWLTHGGGLSVAMKDATLASINSGVPLERALLDSGIDPGKLVRGILDAKNVFAVPFGNSWVEFAVQERIPVADAIRDRIVPLAFSQDSLLGLIEEGSGPALDAVQVGRRALRFVSLGSVPELDARVADLYRELALFAPGEIAIDAYLVRRGVLRPEQTPTGPLKVQSDLLGRYAIDRGAPEGRVAEAHAAFVNRPYLTAQRVEQLRDRLLVMPGSRKTFEAAGFLFIRRLDRHVTAAITKTPDLHLLEAMLERAGCTSVYAVIIAPSVFTCLMDSIVPDMTGPTIASTTNVVQGVDEHHPLEDPGTNTEISGLVDVLFTRALRARASDIHVERYRDRVDIKFRIDGGLERVESPWLGPANVQTFATKIKVDAGLDIAERRRPQDGVIRRRYGGHEVDFRVAVQPTLWGENVVLRVLDQGNETPKLESLGLRHDVLDQFRRLIANPQGLILLTGPA